MKIAEIVLGIARDGRAETLRFDCAGAELVHVDVDPALAPPDELARAVRETIAAPERSAAKAVVLFVRVTLRAGELVLEIADDALAGMRVLTETRAGAMPLIIEAKHGDEEAIDALLARVALAADAADSELLLGALGASGGENRSASSGDAGEEQRSYANAHRRAAELHKAVRAIDEAMTRSVVPDWIWIATALGGVGVFMTVVALLYPEYRVIVLPVLVGGSVLGFGAYGMMSWRELKKRGALLAERRELRARREAARAEVRAFISRGVTLPEGMETAQPRDVPAIVSALEHAQPGRQIIAFSGRRDTPATTSR